MRDEHLKDAAQDAAEDVTQDVAEDVSGAAEDGSLKVFIVARAMFHCPPRFPWAAREGRARQGRGAVAGLDYLSSSRTPTRAFKCGGRCGGHALGHGAGLWLRGPGFGARAPRAFLASPLATTAAAAVFVQLTLRQGRN